MTPYPLPAATPATLEQYVTNYLASKGFSDAEAQIVTLRFKGHALAAPLSPSWGADSGGYPLFMLVALRVSLDAVAVEYIDEVCPHAWFRGMFAPSPEAPHAS
jgi:hypothetical protein